MGYYAPNAEEVYRYIFRLDRNSQSSLCDGFSWSILFVNDSSSICRDFLAQYGAELCYRTADRIRFVFFSGLKTNEYQGLANQAKRSGGGFFARVLQAAVSRISPPRKYDYERDDWDMFRPEAFYPLDSQEHIGQQISVECDMHSAMPGYGEALRLAQTLGIGRFVPCFLLFSDIGAPAVYLFPIAHRTPQQVFERLRIWVDSFYEVNQIALTRWASIESSIKESVGKFQTSIREVAKWRHERKSHWTALQKVSWYLNKLANSTPSTALLQKIIEDYDITRETRNLISPFLDKLKAIDRSQESAQEVKKWIDGVRAATDPQVLHSELSKFKNQDAAKLPESARACLAVAFSQLTPIKQPPSPESELAYWWRSDFGRPPSRNRYEKFRAAWANYSILKYGETAIGKVASIIKDEFEIIQQTALAQPIGSVPEKAAREVVNRLAAHLDVPPLDASWEESISRYRQALTDYYTNLRSHAPAWIIALGSRNLCWKDCIPIIEQRKKAGYKKALDELPRLQELVEQTKMSWESRLREIEAEHKEQQNQCINNLTTTIDSWLSSMSLLAGDRQSVWLSLITSLSHARQDLEDRIFRNAKDSAQASYPGGVISRDESSQLLRLLDEYDRAVKSIKFPFEEDREVLRVALNISLFEASGISANEPITPVAKRLKSELLDVAKDAERSVQEWPVLRQEASAWSPAGKLVGALNDILDPSRMASVLSSLEVESPNAAINVLTSQHQAISALDALSVQELIALERYVVRENPPKGEATATTKQELYDSILVAVGLLPQHNEVVGFDQGRIAASKLQTLQDKVKNGVFDVFLAHNSQDKLAVLRLSQELRRQGIHPWVDVEQIPPGRWFQDVLQSAVRSVKTAAVIIGDSGLGRWQALELRSFVSRCVEDGIPLIPVLLPGVRTIPDSLVFLRELNHVEFKHDVTEGEGLARLIWGITGERL